MFHFLFVEIYQNNVRPDADDLAPRNEEFTVLPEQPHILCGPRHYKRRDLPALLIKLDIADTAKAPAVVRIDYFLIAQLAKTHRTPQQLLS